MAKRALVSQDTEIKNREGRPTLMGPLEEFLPLADDAATFLSLGLRSFTDQSAMKAVEGLAFSKKQSAAYRTSVNHLAQYWKGVPAEQIELHRNRCMTALVLWGAKPQILHRITVEPIVHLLAACCALTK
jgi:hypothetical protein